MAITVDAHHHLWDTSHPKHQYNWMTGDLTVLSGTRRPRDLRPWMEANNFDYSIAVQAIPSVLETEELLAIAAETDFIAGVVGWVDLTAPDVAAQIDTLMSGPSGKYLVGIRHQVHDEDDPTWLLQRDVHSGLRAVAAANRTYDLLVRSRELPAAIDTVQAIPEARFVVDHMAKPEIARGILDPWTSHMKTLATQPNVWVKISGMITEANWYSWSQVDIEPYVETLLEWFGPGRLIFGSDWPVCTLAGTYTQVHDLAQHLLAALTPEQRSQVFGSNAIEAYQLGECL